MKYGKSDVQRKVHALPEMKFENQTLTSFAGLVIFAELKSHCHQDYIPVRTLHGNQTYVPAGLFAYNLLRELQMQTTKPLRCTTAKRASLWIFEKVDTLRKTLIQRAGRLTRPKGTLALTISANNWIKRRPSNGPDSCHDRNSQFSIPN